MESSNNVILGEASESDSEEISLDGENESLHTPPSANITPDIRFQRPQLSDRHRVSLNDESQYHIRENDGGSGTSIFASLTSASTLANKLAQYSQQGLFLRGGSYTETSDPKATTSSSSASTNFPSLLHRGLYSKNRQLYACLDHIHRFPFEKAARDLHIISQRLVMVQKIVQDAEDATSKMKRERNNLDTDLRMLYSSLS